jgi:hypothetical protein
MIHASDEEVFYKSYQFFKRSFGAEFPEFVTYFDK